MATPSPVASCHSERAFFAVGLTGGIGSGKSTVAALLQERGAAVIDTDALAHELTAAGGAAMPAIRAAFGDEYLTAEGALDRARMRALVFGSPPAKRQLEAILHPRIRALALARAAAAAVQAPYVVLVVPLLIESENWRERVARVLVVDCSEATQIARVTRRSRLTPPQVQAIISQQASRAARIAAADDVLFNDGAQTDLPARVARLHALYLQLAAAQR
ncbi:MAG: dephospho-CoA kinase [Sutterellaceae bacterium]|nr:dephospho-CoA kinase [Burkholderiaceae bacterium]MCX7900933.1 dephospho-CoA kinase [Burkholderiaceae bacterium]MDW8429381.1 dephospho-CoA kinase [Sutterellaceae bacterium]